MYRISHTLVATAVLAALTLALALPGLALAHTKVTAGKYELEIGWVNEPPLLGQPNAVFLNVTDTETNKLVEGLNALQIAVATGGQMRNLQLRALGEDAPGQYAADFIPTVRGTYTVKLTGKIEDQEVNISQDIEEVQAAESLQFPVTLPSLPQMSQQLTNLQAENQALRAVASRNQWLAIGGIGLGLAGLIVGVVSLRRR